jgi:hypothetical protein
VAFKYQKLQTWRWCDALRLCSDPERATRLSCVEVRVNGAALSNPNILIVMLEEGEQLYVSCDSNVRTKSNPTSQDGHDSYKDSPVIL